MNLDSVFLYHPRTNVAFFFVFFLKPSKFPAQLLLEIGLAVFSNCAAYMHYIHLPRDLRADQGTSVGPTPSRVGINIRIRPGVSCLASR